MSDISDFLSKKKIARALAPSEGHECFFDGSSLGMGNTLLPCILKSVAGQVARIVIADGHDTGVEMNVPLSSVTAVDSKKMHKLAKNLFRS